MIINKCYLKDIRDYEDRTGKNILDLFKEVSILNVIEIIQAIKPSITENESIAFIDSYFNAGGSLYDLMLELRNVILGYEIDDDGTKDKNEGKNVENIEEYKTMTDFYMNLCQQLMALGVSYSEFWKLTTKEMYQVFNTIQIKNVTEFNNDMTKGHLIAGMIASGVWGKLPEKAPYISLEDLKDPDEIIKTPYGEMTRAEWYDYQAMLELDKDINIRAKFENKEA